jgi:hypothetical protein
MSDHGLDWLKLADAADSKGMAASTLRTHCQDGRAKCVKVEEGAQCPDGSICQATTGQWWVYVADDANAIADDAGGETWPMKQPPSTEPGLIPEDWADLAPWGVTLAALVALAILLRR